MLPGVLAPFPFIDVWQVGELARMAMLVGETSPFSLMAHPDATLFLRILGERASQHPRLFSTITSGLSVIQAQEVKRKPRSCLNVYFAGIA
jgi:hypothetical protein